MLKIDARRKLAEFEWQGQLEIRPGVTALFGQSGAGKTSLVNMVAGLLTPDEGEIAIGGSCVFSSREAVNLPPERRPVGVVFQDGRLFPHLSVRGNLQYGRPRGPRSAPALEEVVELLELEALLGRRPMSLSGGEQQRVAIGRALLTAPDVLLLDEPLAGLDGERRGEVLGFLERLKRDADRIIVYVTHRLEEVVRLADRLVLIDRGEVRAAGGLGDLLGRPELQAVIGQRTAGALLRCRIEQIDDGDGLSRLSCSGHALFLPRLDLRSGSEGANIVLQVRAGDVSLSLEPPRRSSVLNVMRGTVERVVQEDGALADVVVNVGQTLWARITRRSVRELGLSPGAEVYVTIKAASLYSAG
ncbi:MAG: molybdenum ABC transporter ATP-binding protein [Gammaproteobacteria bacterium]|nr:molybdenum ABC transporter ATP-binding protein [Gammaproteobacteria bacterium]